MAPELLIAECANILWKKVIRNELSVGEARLAGRLIALSGIEFVAMKSLLMASLDLAVTLGHPAYDCLCLALAKQRDVRLVTADKRFLALLRNRSPMDAALCLPLDLSSQ